MTIHVRRSFGVSRVKRVCAVAVLIVWGTSLGSAQHQTPPPAKSEQAAPAQSEKALPVQSEESLSLHPGDLVGDLRSGLAESAVRLPLAALFGAAGSASAEFASSVQSFTQGTVAFADGVSTYNNSATAVGEPNHIAGASIFFPGPVTPFNPPFKNDQIVIVGGGGRLMLRLSAPVPAGGAGPGLGVFVNNGLVDASEGGSGRAGRPW
jgi:hypothetical protein